jgi:cell division transport system permease protein
MAKGNKPSGRRGKPSYAMAVVGITLVLFIVGILGWLVLSSKGLEKNLKERVELVAYLPGSLKPAERDSLVNFLQQQPYTRSYKYVSKEEAYKEWLRTGGEDFMQFLDSNVLQPTLNVSLKSDYVVMDTINKITAQLKQFSFVKDISFGQDAVVNMKLVNQITIGLLILAGIMALVAIILIDNTIKLAMFSNRFLIKTMQMVGATRAFIARPMNQRAILNGALAAFISILLMYGAVWLAEYYIPEIRAVKDTRLLISIFAAMLLLGIFISYISTQMSVNKYSKKKLDELY